MSDNEEGEVPGQSRSQFSSRLSDYKSKKKRRRSSRSRSSERKRRRSRSRSRDRGGDRGSGGRRRSRSPDRRRRSRSRDRRSDRARGSDDRRRDDGRGGGSRRDIDNRPSWLRTGGDDRGRGVGARAPPQEEEEDDGLDPDMEDPDDEEDEDTKAARLIAERRAARAAIMNKYKDKDKATGEVGTAPAGADKPAAAEAAASAPAASNDSAPLASDKPSGEAGTAGDAAASSTEGPAEGTAATAADDMFGDAFEADMGLLEGQDRMIDDVDAGLEEDGKDEEGYYAARSGDMFCKGRYQIVSAVGRGVFSSVLCAKDTHRFDADVAIKVIRSNDVMTKLGQKELSLLEELRENDPEDKKHVVKLLNHFKHKGHLCFVFERYDASLREVIKKYGKGVGINIAAVRSYGKQMLIGLMHMAKCSIMHADIKPDNILVNKGRNIIKVCDLGSASKLDECEITPYLVSRFYRAPEIILGHKYDNAIDLWSVACCLYELYTGRYLFPGRDNNHMLKHIQDVRGPFSSKMLRKSMFRELHYTEELVFVSKEKDPVKKSFVFRNIKYTGAKKDLFKMLCPDPAGFDVDELRRIQLLKDVLDKMLTLDPTKRPPVRPPSLAPAQAQVAPWSCRCADGACVVRAQVKEILNHPFFTTK